MSDVKWIKITTEIFDDEKILLIESLPEADSIIVLWFKLLCLAGKNNNSGVFIMNDKIAYTDEMLATVFRRPVNTVRMALNAFERYGMIEIIDGVITIPNWGKHQNFDKIEQKTNYMREYMREYREKQKALIGCKANSKANSKANVSEAEEEIDIDIDIDNKSSKDDMSLSDERNTDDDPVVDEKASMNHKSDIDAVVKAWNDTPFRPIVRMKPDTKRYKMLVARIKEYGLDSVLKAISNAGESEFLRSEKAVSWFDFEWMVRPNNFEKVLEGRYNTGTNQSVSIKKDDPYADYQDV